MSSNEEKTIIGEPVNVTILSGPPSTRRACLVQYSGSQVGKRFILDESEMIVGRHDEAHIQVKDISVSRRHARVVQKGAGWELEDLESANGTYVHEKRVNRDLLKHGDMIRFGSVVFKYFADGSSEGAFVDNIYRKATIDATTQVFNKQYLFDELESHFKVARSYGRPLCLIIFDLDFFKKVNDVHGHNAGDYILKECSQLAKGLVRKNDVLGRFGGEEFVIVLPDTEVKAAFELAERIRQKLAKYVFNFEGKALKQTISIGISQYESGMESTKELLEKADKKLYESKKTGRNRTTV